MDQAEKFDLCFRDHGGRYPDEIVAMVTNGNSLATSVLIHLRDLIRTRKLNFPTIPDIYVGLVNDSKFYVATRKFDDQYFIAFSVGAMEILFHVFHHMMANAKVLTKFGDPSKEDTSIGFLSAEIFDSTVLYEQSDGFIKLPKDPTRGNLAFLLLINALSFLLMHEWGHIANGHLDFKIFMRGVPSISETVKDVDCQGFSCMDLQTLEMDADSVALNQTFGNLITYHVGMQPVNPAFRSFFEDFETAVFLLYFAAHVLLRCHAITVPKVGDLTKLSHPPAGLRMFQLGASIITKFDSILNRKDIPDFAMRLESMAVEAEAAVNLISKEILGPKAYVNSIRLPFQKHSVDYMLHWKNLRPRLEPFSFLELAPIQPEFETYSFDYINEKFRY